MTMISLKRIGRRASTFALLATFALAACDESTTPPPEPGTISGTVTVADVGAPGITVDLSGLATASTTTDASGAFSFPALDPGDYTVSISGADTELVTFDMTSAAVTLESAGTPTVVFAGTPTGVQRVMVFAYFGIDGSKPNVAPAPGFQVDIFRTEFDRDSQANRLGRTTTDANGAAVFTFDRSADTDAGGGSTDNTIFTRVTATPGPRQIGQTDMQQTITWAAQEVVKLAPDTIDVLNGEVTVQFRLQTIQTSYDGPEGSALPEPEWITRSRTDTTGAGIVSSETGFDGVASYELFADVGNLPITVHFRADTIQTTDADNIWTQTPEPTALAAAAGRHITYTHDGTQPPGTLDLGIQRIEYITQSVFTPVYHESDLAEASPMYTEGSDDKVGSTNIQVEILADDQSTVLYTKQAPANGEVFWNGPKAPVQNRSELNAKTVYYVRASSTDPDVEIISQPVYRIGAAGGGSVGDFGPDVGGFRHSARVCPLSADTVIDHCGAFAFKFKNTQVTGTITANALPVQGMSVALYRCTPPDTETCTRDGDPLTTTTNALGVFNFTGNLENIYEIDPDPASAGFSAVTPVGGGPVVVTSGDGGVATRNFTAS